MGYEVDFLAVGESEKSGDAIAMRFGNLQGPRDEQVVVVIDGGYAESGERLVNHIKAYYGTDHVDVIVSTHPDADHAAGLEVVLEELTVGELWMHLPWNHTDDIAKMFRDGRVTDESVEASLRKSLDSARSLERLATKKGIPIREPFMGMRDSTERLIVLGPTMEFYESLLPGFRGTPEPKQVFGVFGRAFQAVEEIVKKVAEAWHIETLDDSGETSAENNSSAVLLLNADDKYLLFTGDAGIPALHGVADILDAAKVDRSKVSFIQVPHHGSQRNVGPTVLDRLIGLRAREGAIVRTAFVSAAKDGAPKHPSKKVLNAFRRRGAPVHLTAGQTKWHHSADAPARAGWGPSIPEPFHHEVED